MRNHFITLLLCLWGTAIAQNTNQTMFRLPDTGQSNSYTSTFGEDNDYTINPPGFINNYNGTVTDTVTGLMWQQTDGGETTIENAFIYCDTLTLATYTNWRLPDAHEGFSILNMQYANPALNTSVFTNTGAEYWWTSARQANDSAKVWATNAGGGVGNHPKSETISAGGSKKFHVRAVREVSNPLILQQRFTTDNNGTVLDHLTNLLWQKTPYTDSLTWEQALTYADTLSLANCRWRLPNIKELQSINDEGNINPSVNQSYFTGVVANKYWSSTTLPNQTARAWYLDTRFGITTYDPKTSRHYLICVSSPAQNTTAVNQPQFTSYPFSAYPNPFTTNLHINSARPGLVYTLGNCVGQIIYCGTNLTEQNLDNLPDGVYFLQQTESGLTLKVIKQ